MTSSTALEMLKVRKRSRRLNLFGVVYETKPLYRYDDAYTNGANANARRVSMSNSTTTGSAHVNSSEYEDDLDMEETDHRSRIHG